MENPTKSLWVMRRPDSGTKVVITDAENRRVCSVDYKTTMRNDEQLLAINTEHASRIVRACNTHHLLLSALESLLEIVEAEYADDPAPEQLEGWEKAINLAQDAIAKAEGRA